MNFLVSCLVVHVSHHSKDVYGGSNQFSWITLYSFIYNHELFTRVRCVQEQPYLLQSFSEKILVHHFLMPRLLPTKQMFSLNVRKRLGPVSVACLSELAMLKPMEVFLKTLLLCVNQSLTEEANVIFCWTQHPCEHWTASLPMTIGITLPSFC